MDPKTGRIVEVSSEQDARDRGLVPIPGHEIAALQAASEGRRIAWASGKLRSEAVRHAISDATSVAYTAGGSAARNARKRAKKAVRPAKKAVRRG